MLVDNEIIRKGPRCNEKENTVDEIINYDAKSKSTKNNSVKKYCSNQHLNKSHNMSK